MEVLRPLRRMDPDRRGPLPSLPPGAPHKVALRLSQMNEPQDMKALLFADAFLFILFLLTLRFAALGDGAEIIGLLAFLLWGLPALVLVTVSFS
jgi:hypothetical protein